MSLNDCLAKGPNFTPLVFHILLRFRFFCVELVADIEKAFHQIVIEKSDRDMLRYLWFEDVQSNSNIVHYHFCQLPFGLKPSPAILNSVIQNHISLYNQSHPHVSKLLSESFYVDDFVGGAATVKENEEIYNASQKIMMEGGFHLRKWHTNVQALREMMSKENDSQVRCNVIKRYLA